MMDDDDGSYPLRGAFFGVFFIYLFSLITIFFQTTTTHLHNDNNDTSTNGQTATKR